MEFGALIGVSQAAVERYVNGKRIPEPEVMQKIFEATSGHVTANDFYDFPDPPPGNGHKKRKGA